MCASYRDDMKWSLLCRHGGGRESLCMSRDMSVFGRIKATVLTLNWV